jgi:16S rRNA (cytosine1407-C5)-methyltransferase
MIVSWFENAFILPHITFKQLSQMNIFPRGEIYVQNLSSMVPPILLNPKPGEKVLDICSAPGSKTTQMAAMMQNTGEVLAVDSSLRRLEVLKANLLIQGVTNTSVLHGNGQDIWKTYPNYFDKALVDVPCSMEGKFFILDPKTYSFWSLEKIHEYARISQWLLLSAVGAVRVGGEILYSTCTIAPEENESVIDWILKKTKHTVRIIDMEYSGIPYIPGLRSWREKQYMLGMEKTWRILPSKILEGFFIAKLKKLE